MLAQKSKKKIKIQNRFYFLLFFPNKLIIQKHIPVLKQIYITKK